MRKTLVILSLLCANFYTCYSQINGDFTVDHVVYEIISIDDMTLRAIGLDQSTNGEPRIITIPSTLEYLEHVFYVTEVDLAFNTANLVTLNLSEGLLYLNLNNSLIRGELHIPSTVTRIGTIKTSILDYMNIPPSVTSIYKCQASRIKYLDIEDGDSILELRSDYQQGSFYNVPVDTLYLGRTCWGSSWNNELDYSFSNCRIKELSIGRQVKSLPRFSNNDFSRIVIPNNVEMMNVESFTDCQYLETVVIEDGIFPIVKTGFDGYGSGNRPLIINQNIINMYIGRNCDDLILSLFPLVQLSFGPGVISFDSFYTNQNNSIVDVYGTSSCVKVYQLTPPDISLGFSTRTYLETPLFVPNGTKELYQQANIWKNFFNIYEFDWESPQFCIFLCANSDNMGSVIGQDIYEIGQEVSVNAIPNEYYRFVNWTENDSIVSTNANYRFICDNNRFLVANFESGFRTVDFYTSHLGYYIGSGTYQYGDTVTIQAFPYDGNLFRCWVTYNNSQTDTISFDNPYSFIITEDVKFDAIFSGLGVEDDSCEFALFPNPTEGFVIFKGILVNRIEVYNSVSQLVKETKDNLLDLSDQLPGIYIIKIITPSDIITKQIIKK